MSVNGGSVKLSPARDVWLPQNATQSKKEGHPARSTKPKSFCAPRASSTDFNEFASSYRLTEGTVLARCRSRSWIETLLEHPEVVIKADDKLLIEKAIAPYLLNFQKCGEEVTVQKTYRFLQRCGRPSGSGGCRERDVSRKCGRIAMTEDAPLSLSRARDELKKVIDFRALNFLLEERDKALGPNLMEEGHKRALLDKHIAAFYNLPIAIGDWRAGDRSLRTPDFTVPELCYEGKIVVFDPHVFHKTPNRTIAQDVERWRGLRRATQKQVYSVLVSNTPLRYLELSIGCKLDCIADEYWMIPGGNHGGETKERISENMENLLSRKDCVCNDFFFGLHVPQEFLDRVAGGMYLINAKRK